jgi:hypothetical protein
LNGTHKVSFKIGIQDFQVIDAKIKDGKLENSSPLLNWTFDCIQNNDLVDYFKTFLEGHLSVTI